MSKLTTLLLVGQLSIIGLKGSHEKDRVIVAKRMDKNVVTVMTARKEIVLKEGFVAEKGADFLASIHSQSGDDYGMTIDQTRLENQHLRSLKFYPNPTSDILNITYDANLFDATTPLTIYNLKGELITTIHIEFSGQRIDLSDLTEGIYLAKWTSSDYRSMVKIIKK